jgi:RNA polymerase sigma factor (TIGR02999 family)
MVQLNSQDVDALLGRVRAGDSQARDLLITEIYPELKRLANFVMTRSEYRRNHTLSPTALVSLLWLKMAVPPKDKTRKSQLDNIPNTAVLIWTVKKNLDDILTDYARARRAQKRPTALTRVDLQQMMSLGEWMRQLRVDSLDIHQALKELKGREAQQAEALEFKYLMGYTIEEGAAAMGLAVITYRRLCDGGEAWLKKRLQVLSDSRM